METFLVDLQLVNSNAASSQSQYICLRIAQQLNS
jgi:hypothetical protein